MSEVLAQLEKKGGGGNVTVLANFINTNNAGQFSTFTFDQTVAKGFVFLNATNNATGDAYYEAFIDSLSGGTFTLEAQNKFLGTNFGTKSAVYYIQNVPKNAVMTYRTRYTGPVIILKID